MSDKVTVGELVYKISGDMDNLKTELKKAETEINNLKSAMEKTSDASEGVNKKLAGAATAFKAFFAGFAIKQVIDFGAAAVKSASEQLEQQTKLAQVLRTSRNATDEQIQSLIEQANALEQIGVISKDVTIAAQAQLATYDLSTDAIKTLTPALLDYLAAEKGANATKEDAKALTNGLAQAIQGNYASLSKTGFILDETTKKLIENGTETERVQAITEVLNSTYKDYNKALGDTFLGTQVRAQNQFNDFKDDLGFALMPTIQMLTQNLLDLTGGFESGAPRINAWGKGIYQVTNFVIAMGKAFILVVQALTGFGDMLYRTGKVVANFAKNSIGFVTNVKDNFTSLGAGLLKVFKGDFSGAVDELKKRVTDQFSDTGNAMDDFKYEAQGWGQTLSDQFDSVGQSAVEAFDAVNFKPITAEALTAYDAAKKVEEGFGGMSDSAKKEAEKAAKAIDDFQSKLVDLIDQSRKTSKELEGNLSDSFKKFAENIKGNFEDSVTSLAKIVVDAEQKVKDLNQQIADERADLSKKLADIDGKDAAKNRADAQAASDARIADIQKQIDAENAIIASRQGFEERQAKVISDIRAKLEANGIDAAKAGLDDVLNVKSLQDQIDEERRRASLNEFQLFEEDQNKKLQILVDNFVAEVKITQDKIDKQKEFEADLTSYLASENSTRLENTDAWAKATIEKYGEVAQSLQNLISLKARLGDASAAAAAAAATTAPALVTPEQTPSQSINNSKTVNAPVTINAPGASSTVDYRAVSREMGFEISKM